MTDRPSSDFSHLPQAHQAYDLSKLATRQTEPPPRRPSWWSRHKKAFVIASIAVLGTGGVFGGVIQYFSDQANKAVENAFTDPLFAFDVHTLEPPAYYDTGYMVPGATTDEDFHGTDADTMYGGASSSTWAFERNGSFAGWGQWEIVLEGNRDETVTVTDLYPTEVECSKPEGGTYFPLTYQGIGEKIGLAVQIDDPDARIKQLPLDEPNSFDPPDLDALPSFSDSSTITLTRGEKEVIVFLAHADQEHCKFALAVEYLAEGERQTSLIAPPDPGHFTVAPVLDYADYESVVLPWMFCTDGQPHVVSGARAVEIAAEVEQSLGSPVDCI